MKLYQSIFTNQHNIVMDSTILHCIQCDKVRWFILQVEFHTGELKLIY